MSQVRPHTGRRRNEAVRAAVLDAAVRLMRSGGAVPLTMRALAEEAGVGKQTVYRWWSSPGDVLLEAFAAFAAGQVPAPDTGTLRGDLGQFLSRTFGSAREPATTAVLRGLVVQAARDAQAEQLLRSFTAARRAALAAVISRHADRRGPDADLDLIVDQVFGVLWYRLILGHNPLDEASARRLAVIAERAWTG